MLFKKKIDRQSHLHVTCYHPAPLRTAKYCVSKKFIQKSANFKTIVKYCKSSL